MERGFLGGFVILTAAQGAQRFVLQARVHADQHVFQDGHFTEEADVLVGTGDAEGADFIRAQAEQAAALEAHVAFFGRVEAVQAVKERGLASAVGADDGADAAAGDGEVDVIQRGQATETLGESADFQEG